MYQQIRHGLKNRTQQINNRCCFTAKFQRILCRIYFRHDFPEKQQQKSKHNRYEQKLKQLSIAKIYHAGKKKLHNMIIVTLTKLFEIRMVASKRSESSSKALMRESEGCSFSSTLLRSEGDNEKSDFGCRNKTRSIQ